VTSGFGRDAERDVVLDRFLERVGRLAGEYLAAWGAVGVEQLDDGVAWPEAGGEEGVAHVERLDGPPGKVEAGIRPGGGAGGGGGVSAVCGACARHGGAVAGGEYEGMRDRAQRCVDDDLAAAGHGESCPRRQR
jgi:hypothetical protein